MGFDLASAKPAAGFDLASARPAAAPVQPPPETSLADIGSNFLSAAMRPVINAVGTIPEMAANAGVGLRNLTEQGMHRIAPDLTNAIYAANRHLAGDNQLLQALLPQGYDPNGYGSFSSMYRPALAQTYGEPQGLIEKAPEAVSTMLLGSRVPAPEAAQQAPANFVKPQVTPRDMTLSASQGAGYVVPPSTTNPTTTNKMLESLGGKIATAQDARVVNDNVTNQLARKALGLADDEPITPELLRDIRSTASEANEHIRTTGKIVTDDIFENGISDVLAKYRSASGVSKKLANTDLKELGESFEKEFDSSDAVDAIQVLRDRASSAFSKGEPELGRGYRAMSKVIEDQVERHLKSIGQSGQDILKQFRDGRQLIAKTFSVEEALNPSTGSVSALKLASQLKNDVPLSGPLKTAAKFGQAFPSAARPVTDSGSVRNTDVLLGGLGAVLDKSTWPLIYPFARLGARAGLLSQAGQKLAVPGTQSTVPPGLLMGLGAGEEDLLGQ